MVETIFTNQLFVETVLPFVLVFTIVFAILQKTSILGKDKKQIDAIVALVIGLTFVAFPAPTEIVVKMIPVLGVALATIFVFLILLGSLFKADEFAVHKYLKVGLGIVIGILVIVTLMILTGGFDYFYDFVLGDTTGLVLNVILVVIVIGAIVAVVIPKSGSGDKKKSE